MPTNSIQEPPPSKLCSFLDACSKPDPEYELASRPIKRRKIIEATCGDEGTFPPRAENPYLNHLKPYIKPRHSKKRNTKGFEEHNTDFLTLARVDIDLVRTKLRYNLPDEAPMADVATGIRFYAISV